MHLVPKTLFLQKRKSAKGDYPAHSAKINRLKSKYPIYRSLEVNVTQPISGWEALTPSLEGHILLFSTKFDFQQKSYA